MRGVSAACGVSYHEYAVYECDVFGRPLFEVDDDEVLVALVVMAGYDKIYAEVRWVYAVLYHYAAIHRDLGRADDSGHALKGVVP